MFNKNPSQLIVPASSTPSLRRLLLRNTGFTTVVCKLIVSNAKVISLKSDKVRISAGETVVLEAEINYNKVGTLDYSSHTITGYVLPLKQFNAINITHWLNDGAPGCPRQKAFQLTVAFNSEFSSRDTVLEIPGEASLVVAVPKSIPYNEKAEADAGTAKAIGSQEDLASLRVNQSTCWLQDFFSKPRAHKSRSNPANASIEQVEPAQGTKTRTRDTGSNSKSSERQSRSKSRKSSKSRRNSKSKSRKSSRKSSRGASKSGRAGKSSKSLKSAKSGKSSKSRRSSKSARAGKSSKSAKSSRRAGSSRKSTRSARGASKSKRSSKKSCGSKVKSSRKGREVACVA